jgi:tRNA dimethylallyltransferase
MKDKIIVILGQTSSGKTDLSVDLARKFNGEIISADSQQIYKGLDIGSGKVTKKEMQGIRHHLLDVVSPRSVFSVAQFKKKSDKVIKDVLKRGKLPIVAGGTGQYIQAIVDDIVLPEVKPNLKLRKELEKKSAQELGNILKKMDIGRFKEIDQKNPRRLVRAIEIATALGKVPKLTITELWSNKDFLQIGIKVDDDILKERIEKRFKKRVKQGIVAEAKKLHEQGVSWKRMNQIGLAHKYVVKYIKGEISKEQMTEGAIREERRYAKRQKTWFKRDKRIRWFEYDDKQKIFDEAELFLEKK